MPKPWRRKLWGVWFTSKNDPRGFLISATWDNRVRNVSCDEPLRRLLFSRRAVARQVAQSLTARHMGLELGWKFRAVRVEEIVRVVK